MVIELFENGRMFLDVELGQNATFLHLSRLIERLKPETIKIKRKATRDR